MIGSDDHFGLMLIFILDCQIYV